MLDAFGYPYKKMNAGETTSEEMKGINIEASKMFYSCFLKSVGNPNKEIVPFFKCKYEEIKNLN
ncbi:hypothetical protein [Cognatitamlana onchidii]|uniref:hypothetical protein n=1 Tax=Cognatitamlana onchidii TaxID=2562860 RepID=UPI0010A5EB27|nr:hypothetical protein [Algibacter onchidii]